MNYAFRVICPTTGEPTGWYGLVVAPNKWELFSQIDEHCSPYDVEIATLRNTGLCFKVEEIEDECVEGETFPAVVEWEQGETFSEIFDSEVLNWRKPKWPTTPYTRVVKSGIIG